ncbi:MAG TPA: GIY-YIG nuclease family protein [Thermoanaerobaculia bacterium]|nr:GIY-YIG nuclease family protein [Thermoanaerobaculia bacterium]
MSYKQYWVYMLTNRWTTVLYTGVTGELFKRIWQHKNKAVPGFTSKYNCDRLVYFEEFSEIDQAIAREKQIKGWLRIKKNALVASKNPGWNDLSADWFEHEPAGGPSLRSG